MNPKASARRILVRAPNWIGDQILARPFFEALRDQNPDAHIASLCVPWVMDVQFRDLVDQVIPLPKAQVSGLFGKLSHFEERAQELKKLGPWDLGYSLPNSWSAAWILFRAGVRERVGYATEGRRLILTRAKRWDPKPSRHRSQSYLDLLEGAPQLSDEGSVGGLESFQGSESLKAPVENYWVMAPGSQADSRRWFKESFIQLADLIWNERKLPVCLVGGPKEALLCEEIKDSLNSGSSQIRAYDLCSQGPISSLVPLFQKSEFVICNDSGLAHVANFAGARVGVVWGAGDPRRTRPLVEAPLAPGEPTRVSLMIQPVDCWPCEKNQCYQPPDLQLQCLRQIKPEWVWEEMKRNLK